jgi:hypothetical protein
MNAANYNWTEPINRASDKPGEIQVGLNTAFERCPAPSVESMLETLVVTGPNEIHINTYLDHPEGFHRTLTSFDVWVPRGRGFPIGFDKFSVLASGCSIYPST